MERRKFLKYAAASAAAAVLGGTGYAAFEAGWFHVQTQRVTVPQLPAAFSGLRVAFLTDMHHGPWTGLKYVEATVKAANELHPDLVLLGGDYTHNGSQFIEPCIDALGDLSAPLGVHGVLGNHDCWNGPRRTRRAMELRNINCLVNDGIWLTRGNSRLFLAGVDDFLQSVSDLDAALDQLPEEEPCVLLSHNPDFADKLEDERVKLILSGHTHGGQVVFPLLGAPFVPSVHSQKYLQGLIQTPTSQVFVSRGLGTVTPPVRFNCRPEINLLEWV